MAKNSAHWWKPWQLFQGDLSDKQHLLRYMTVTELSALPAFAKAEQGNARRPFVCLLMSPSSPGQKETKTFYFFAFYGNPRPIFFLLHKDRKFRTGFG